MQQQKQQPTVSSMLREIQEFDFLQEPMQQTTQMQQAIAQAINQRSLVQAKEKQVMRAPIKPQSSKIRD